MKLKDNIVFSVFHNTISYYNGGRQLGRYLCLENYINTVLELEYNYEKGMQKYKK